MKKDWHSNNIIQKYKNNVLKYDIKTLKQSNHIIFVEYNIVFSCTLNFFKISNNNYFKGNFHQKYESSLKKLEAEFWPNRLNVLSILDRIYWLIYKDKSNSFTIINSNHQKILLESHEIITWSCITIPFKAVYDTFF
jgi:hypothetical protein